MKLTRQGVRDLNSKQINMRTNDPILCTMKHEWSGWHKLGENLDVYRECLVCGELKIGRG